MDKNYKNIGNIEDILIEECSELIQIICKIKRFGIDNYHPVTKEKNIDLVKSEIADVKEAIKRFESKLIKPVKRSNV